MKKIPTLLLSLSFGTGFAQVSYTNVTPVRVLNGTTSSNGLDSVKLHLAHPLTATIGKDSALHIWHFDAPPTFSNDVGIDCRGNNVELLKLSTSSNPFQIAAIDSGVMIDASAGTWERPNYDRLAIENAPDNWDSKTDKYLGVRFKRNGAWHYGWIKMSVDAMPTKAEIKGYAYDKTAGKSIIAGNKGSSINVMELSSALDISITYTNALLTFANLEHPYKVHILDINGKNIYTSTVDSKNNKINVSLIPAGVYVIDAISQNKRVKQKINIY